MDSLYTQMGRSFWVNTTNGIIGPIALLQIIGREYVLV